ncbi:MAG: hypothetical protein KGL35_19215 [Bradyrhizobium sp.]|uniref:hypothetical protein n=1 Tax=Bradyrhizobium sp. TaxID=376 RepID=UPI0023A182D9|nr:hypothetical protein [Bradyrhizobium sp.]MDE2066047.1 hypothetical protein [Bradyrhizobium sp.]MDE2470812.1 hypothetical protein [Bradyrhizobium sp.]
MDNFVQDCSLCFMPYHDGHGSGLCPMCRDAAVPSDAAPDSAKVEAAAAALSKKLAELDGKPFLKVVRSGSPRPKLTIKRGPD